MAFNRETGTTKKKKTASATDVLKKTGEALTSLVEKAAEATDTAPQKTEKEPAVREQTAKTEEPKPQNLWQNLASTVKGAVPALMQTAVAQSAAEKDDPQTVYDKLKSGDITYTQYYDLKTGGLLSRYRAAVADTKADFTSPQTYHRIRSLAEETQRFEPILGKVMTDEMSMDIASLLDKTAGLTAQRKGESRMQEADALIEGFENVKTKFGSGNAQDLVRYLQAVERAVGNIGAAAEEYLPFAADGESYMQGIQSRLDALSEIYGVVSDAHFQMSLDALLKDSQLQELLKQRDDNEYKRHSWTDSDGTAVDLSPVSQFLDAVGIVDFKTYEEQLLDLDASDKSLNAKIKERLQQLGFSGVSASEFYEAYKNDALEEFAKNSPVFASVLSVAGNVGSSFALGDTISSVFTGEQDTNESYIAQKGSTMLRSAAAEEFSDWYKEHPTVVSELIDKGLGFLGAEDAGVYFYNTMMSAADDLARTGLISVLTMGMGASAKTAEKIVKALSTAVASSSALSTNFVQEIENGESAGDALLSSLIGAVAEGASEYLSLELIFKDGGKSVLKKIAKDAFFEGSEEVIGQILETGLDMLFLKDKSDVLSRRDELRAQGLSDSEIFKTIITEELKEAGLNFLSGALSAGGTSLGTASVTQPVTKAQTRAYGKQIIAADRVADLLEQTRNTEQTASERKAVEQASGEDKNYAAKVGELFRAYSEVQTDRTVLNAFLKKADVQTVQTQADTAPTQTPTQADGQTEHRFELGFTLGGAPVTPLAVVQDTDGETRLLLDHATGATAEVDDLQVTDEATQKVKTVLSGDTIGAVGKDFLLQALQQDGDAGDIDAWISDYEEYYKAGLQGFVNAQAYESAHGTQDIGLYLSVYQKEIAVTAGLSERQYTNGVTWLSDGNVPISGETEMQSQLLDAVGKQYGLAFVLTDKLEHANGLYVKNMQSNRIVLSLDAEGGILTAAAGHEVFHYLKENAANAAESLQKFILHRLLASEGFDLNAELAKYRDRYALETQGMTEKEQRIYLLEELTADSMFGVFSSKQAVELYARQQTKNAKKVAKAIRNFYEKVKKALETLSFKGMGTVSALQQQAQTLEQISDLFFAALEEAQANRRQNKNTAESGGGEIRKSKAVDDAHKSDILLMQQLQDWLKGTGKQYGSFNGSYFELGQTPVSLVDNGARPLPMIMYEDCVAKITGMKDDYAHTISLEEIAKLPSQLNDPILLFRGSVENSFVALTEMVDKQGHDVIVAIHINKRNRRIEINKIASLYSKTDSYGNNKIINYVITQINDGKLLDASEKKASKWFTIRGLQLPKMVQTILDAKTRLSQNDNSVNSQSMQKSKENVSNNDTTQFSAKISSDTADYVTRLQQENADLQAALEAARAELHETRGLTISDAELRKISDFFADTLQSDLTREDLFKALRGYFDYAADGGDLNVVLGTMTDLYLEAMQTSHSAMLWTELYDDQKDVLTDLRTNPVYLSEIQTATVTENFDGYKNFQRASFGKIRFVKNHDGNHATLDTRWSELCALSHGLLDENTPDYAQPEALLDYYAATRPMWMDTGNPHGKTAQELEDAAYSMAWSTLMEYLDAPKVQTFADKAAAKVRKAKRERDAVWRERFNAYRDKRDAELAEQRAAFEARIAAVCEKRDSKLNERKEYYLQRIDGIRERRRTADERERLRRSVRRGAKRLADLLVNETDQKHVPEKLKAQISTFLELFSSDESTFSESKLLALLAAYNEYGKDEESGSCFDEDMAERIDEMRSALHGKRLTALNNKELQTLKDLTDHFVKIVRDGNKQFYLGKKADRDKVGEEAVAAYTAAQAKRQFKLLKPFETLLHTNMLSPNSFFELLQGPLAEEYEYMLYHDQDVFGRRVLQGTQFLQDKKKQYGYRKWKDSKLTLPTEDGETLQLTADEVCLLWATYRREHLGTQQARHLEEGGIVFKDELGRSAKGKIKNHLFEVRDGTAHRLSEKDFDKIAEFMTDEMRDFTADLVGFLSNDAAEWGNAVSMEKYGIRKFTEKHYIPYNTAQNYSFRKFGTDVQNGTNRLMNRSWTKSTVKGANMPIVVDGLTAVWSSHVAEMAQYSAFALTLDSMEQIFNYRAVQPDGRSSRVSSIISTYYGRKYMDYFTTFMTDLNGKNYTDSRDGMLTRLLSKSKKAAVMLSLSVAVQQPTSYFRAMQELGVTSMLVLPGTKKTYSEMLEYAPGVTLIKEVGGFDSLVGKTMQGYIAQEQYKGLPQKVKGLFADSDYRDSVFGLLPGKLDQMTWQSIWKATKKQVKKETRLAGTDLLQETGKQFTKIINDTQVYGSVLSQSHAMRSKSPIMKMTTAFMAEPTVNYNMLLRFGRELQNKNIKKAFAIGLSLVVSSVAQGVLKSLVTAGRDDDKEKTYAEKYLRDVVNELLGNLPFNWIIGLRDIISWLQGYSNERDDLSVITDLLESVADVFDSEETVENRMQALVTALSTVIGVPLGNAWRDFEMIVRAISALEEERDLTATATSIGYSIAENFSFWSNALLRDTPLYWDNSQEKYFERAYLALQEGDGQKYRDTLDYIRRNEKVTEKDIRNGIAKQIAVHSETAQTAAAAYMVGDTYGYEQGLFALVDLGFDEETAAKGIEKAQAEIEKLLDGAAAQELQNNTQERDNVIADLADLFGDSDSLADLYADVLQDAQEDDEEEEPVLRYKVSDVARTLQYGDLNQAIEIRDYLLENGKEKKNIRSAVTTAIKPLYLQAYKDGDMNAVSDYIDMLSALDLGYKASDFEQWEKDAEK